MKIFCWQLCIKSYLSSPPQHSPLCLTHSPILFPTNKLTLGLTGQRRKKEKRKKKDISQIDLQIHGTYTHPLLFIQSTKVKITYQWLSPYLPPCVKPLFTNGREGGKKYTYPWAHRECEHRHWDLRAAVAVHWLVMAGRHPQAQNTKTTKTCWTGWGRMPYHWDNTHTRTEKMQALREILHTSIINSDLNQNG